MFLRYFNLKSMDNYWALCNKELAENHGAVNQLHDVSRCFRLLDIFPVQQLIQFHAIFSFAFLIITTFLFHFPLFSTVSSSLYLKYEIVFPLNFLIACLECLYSSLIQSLLSSSTFSYYLNFHPTSNHQTLSSRALMDQMVKHMHFVKETALNCMVNINRTCKWLILFWKNARTHVLTIWYSDDQYCFLLFVFNFPSSEHLLVSYHDEYFWVEFFMLTLCK